MHNEIVSLEKSHKLNGFSNIGRGYPHVLDNYATIPELVRQRQISATFGTFVHRKYWLNKSPTILHFTNFHELSNFIMF